MSFPQTKSKLSLAHKSVLGLLGDEELLNAIEGELGSDALQAFKNKIHSIEENLHDAMIDLEIPFVSNEEIESRLLEALG